MHQLITWGHYPVVDSEMQQHLSTMNHSQTTELFSKLAKDLGHHQPVTVHIRISFETN